MAHHHTVEIAGGEQLTQRIERLRELTTITDLRISDFRLPSTSDMPDCISKISSLETLRLLRVSNKKSLPDGISTLCLLQELIVTECEDMESLPHLPAYCP